MAESSSLICVVRLGNDAPWEATVPGKDSICLVLFGFSVSDSIYLFGAFRSFGEVTEAHGGRVVLFEHGEASWGWGWVVPTDDVCRAEGWWKDPGTAPPLFAPQPLGRWLRFFVRF